MMQDRTAEQIRECVLGFFRKEDIFREITDVTIGPAADAPGGWSVIEYVSPAGMTALRSQMASDRLAELRSTYQFVE